MISQFINAALQSGCPQDQVQNFIDAGIFLQPKQLAASAAARLCDRPDGPTALGFGGARGGGKSFWLLAQMGADDCQRVPGLKCLLLRKVGKSNLENFEDLRRRLFPRLPHDFSVTRRLLTFANGSRIIAGHFQCEKDIDAYLGLEYDIIGIEEATTLTSRKYHDIVTCCRSSKLLPPADAALNSQPSTLNSAPPPSDPYSLSPIAYNSPSPIAPYWRPRVYSTTNPGGVGHAWYRTRYIVPFQQHQETDTRFIPATLTDNTFLNTEYRQTLDSLAGWQQRAWRDGDWDIAAGQFFTTFRRDVHVIDEFNDRRAIEWYAALDYGFNHYTVAVLGCKDNDGNFIIVDEHSARGWVPERHAQAIKAMLQRHNVRIHPGYEPTPFRSINARAFDPETVIPNSHLLLKRFSAGTDLFARQSTGATIASQYAALGIPLRPANTERVNGWAEILKRLGDPAAGVKPTLFFHRRCTRLIDCLPTLQHDPNRPEDVLKVDPDDAGIGGDDAADALRYLIATKLAEVRMAKLRGF